MRLLPSHTLADAISGLPSRFNYTLAKHLGKGRRCIPLLSALSSGGCLGIVHHLSTTRRQLLLDELREDFRFYLPLVKENSKKLKRLQALYDIAQLITTLQVPIFCLPVELLTEVFRFAVDHLGVAQDTLQRVCKSWSDLIARLWGTLHVGTWTNIESVCKVLRWNSSSMTVAIDTERDAARSVTSEKPYDALRLTWIDTSRWRSLTLHSFPSKSGILGGTPFYPRAPLENLDSLSVGPVCNSSDYINEILEASAPIVTPKLTSLTLATTNALQRLNQLQCAYIYSKLTFLEVNVVKFRQPINFLRHCACLETLKLSGVFSTHLSSEDELPFLQTLHHLRLEKAPIQWMVGRAFKQLKSCILLRLINLHAIDQASIMTLPVCTSIALQSHFVRILAAFHTPMVNALKIECNEWSKPHGSRELNIVWSPRWDQRMLRPKVLSIQILCSDHALLGALKQMATLEELVLMLPHPSGLGVGFFEALCAVPVNPFTGSS